MKKNYTGGITLIALVITIIVLLILAGVSIAMLTGENGVLTQASKSKMQTEIAEAKEQAKLDIMAWRAEKIANGEDATLDDATVKTILTGKDYVETLGETSFTTENGYEITYSELYSTIPTTGGGSSGIYSIPGLEEEASKNVDLFKYEIIDKGEVASTTLGSLPTKKARITGIKEKYCNSMKEGYYDEETGETVASTNYGIVYKGEAITDTLVIPYQVEIGGEMYKITEANISAYGEHGKDYQIGYALPHVKTIIYPNTIEKIYSSYMGDLRDTGIENVILSENLKTIGDDVFKYCASLKSITIPESVTRIGDSAFYGNGLIDIIIPSSVTSIDINAFLGCWSLKTVNYRGTEEQWSQITIKSGNEVLTNAENINFNYTGE